MLKIGEFSKLSQMTVKALRFYEKEDLLIPASVDEWTGYRFYTTDQLTTVARIKSYRQLNLSIEEIKAIFKGKNPRKILEEKNWRSLCIHHEICRRKRLQNCRTFQRMLHRWNLEQGICRRLAYRDSVAD